jgi:hypothetical protein
MALGMLFVLALWVVAGAAARSRGADRLVVIGFLWGLLLPIVGIGQLYWLPGGWHWSVRVVHLLIGMAGMGIADRLGKRVG